MCIDVLLHFLHTPAVRMNIYLGKRRTGQGTRFFFKERKFIQDRHKLNDRIKSLFFGSKRIQQRIYFEYGRHREAKPFLCFIQHPADRVELILIDKALEDIRTKNIGDVPNHLKNPSSEYKYPHNYKNDYVRQQYLPDNLLGSKYYIPKDNKNERIYKEIINRLDNM